MCFCVFFFFKQKTAYEMRISDWSSDVCALPVSRRGPGPPVHGLLDRGPPQDGLQAPLPAAGSIHRPRMAATGARGRCMKRLIPLCLLLLACAGCVRMHVYGDPQAYAAGAGDTLRIATYNASLHDDAAGGLVRRLESGDRKSTRLNSSH